jgi:PST family polysaccharide transporter
MAQAICGYFSMLINYGFNISATKDISVYRDNKNMLSEIFSSIFIIKIALFLMAFLFLLILIFMIPTMAKERWLYLITYSFCFNELLFHQYYFQGIEKMRYITIINSIPRLLSFILIFLLVKSPTDYLTVPALNGIGALLSGCFALYIILYKEKLVIKWQSLCTLWHYFKESSPFFFSRILGVIVHRTNTIILGSFIGYREVAYYDLAQKIQTVLLIPYDILNQVIYPYMARRKDMQVIKKVLSLVVLTALILYILLICFDRQIIDIVAGKDMQQASTLLILLCFGVLPISINYFLGNTTLVVAGFNSSFNKSVAYAALVYFLLIIIFFTINQISIYSLALATIISNCYCASYRFICAKKNKIL